MKIAHNTFNLGFKIGSLARDIELVIETMNKKTDKEKVKIEAYRVHETIKYVYDELDSLNILDKIKDDMGDYLANLTGFGLSDDDESERKGLITKVKKGIADRKLRLNRNLNSQEISELDLKIKSWKDRITSDLVKLAM